MILMRVIFTTLQSSTTLICIDCMPRRYRITEMDVTCGGYSRPCGDAQFAHQAQIYGDVLQACLNNSKCTIMYVFPPLRLNFYRYRRKISSMLTGTLELVYVSVARSIA